MAIVLSLLFLFMGVLAIRSLPIAQFPDIAPPRVTISLSFPGASAEVLVKSSLITIERAINGVPGMKYIVSDATSAGEATIQILFDLGVDPNIAMVNVKTRVDQVMSRLPNLVRLEGVIVIDANNGESLSLLQSDPERFLVVTADTSNSLARIWKAGARHVVFTKDSPNTAQLAIIATELQLSDEFSPEIEPHPLESAGTLHRPRVQ